MNELSGLRLRSDSFLVILFENLFKPRQFRLTVYMLLTSSVLSTTSKQCFEQPAASFLVCSLIFIEYQSVPIQLSFFYLVLHSNLA